MTAVSDPESGIHPKNIRVWQGFRKADFAAGREKFNARLGQIFIPATVQQMQPVGLQAYFPLILPESHFVRPDELALVVYPSQDAYYQASRETVAGRAYGALHATVFNFSREGSIPRSRSSFPVFWSQADITDQAYFLRDQAVEWHQGQLRCVVLSCDDLQFKSSRNTSADGRKNPEFVVKISEIVAKWRKQSPAGDNAVLQLEDGYLLCWEHYTQQRTADSLCDALVGLADSAVIVDASSQQVRVEPVFAYPDAGVDPATGVLMDVRLATGE